MTESFQDGSARLDAIGDGHRPGATEQTSPESREEIRERQTGEHDISTGTQALLTQTGEHPTSPTQQIGIEQRTRTAVVPDGDDSRAGKAISRTQESADRIPRIVVGELQLGPSVAGLLGRAVHECALLLVRLVFGPHCGGRREM
ncbi:hypothetical protein BBN63_00320 [Streptomyces niveus]|uniref:Uncharacterized protein n=1 Tax=Streptomyces niveus TaxID=193462 RepID=A0A1U9QMC5_STRNV|nr:hypothetical protein BBN63_00320 [Streptomyces niveus]